MLPSSPPYWPPEPPPSTDPNAPKNSTKPFPAFDAATLPPVALDQWPPPPIPPRDLPPPDVALPNDCKPPLLPSEGVPIEDVETLGMPPLLPVEMPATDVPSAWLPSAWRIAGAEVPRAGPLPATAWPSLRPAPPNCVDPPLPSAPPIVLPTLAAPCAAPLFFQSLLMTATGLDTQLPGPLKAWFPSRRDQARTRPRCFVSACPRRGVEKPFARFCRYGFHYVMMAGYARCSTAARRR